MAWSDERSTSVCDNDVERMNTTGVSDALAHKPFWKNTKTDHRNSDHRARSLTRHQLPAAALPPAPSKLCADTAECWLLTLAEQLSVSLLHVSSAHSFESASCRPKLLGRWRWWLGECQSPHEHEISWVPVPVIGFKQYCRDYRAVHSFLLF